MRAHFSNQTSVGLATIRDKKILEKVDVLQKIGYNIVVEHIEVNGSMVSTMKQLPDTLAADINRHGKGIAKIWVYDNTLSETKKLLEVCLS